MKKILIVDDAAFMRMMLKDILIKNGFEVCGEACNGKEAIERYKELNPDLITLDITMPNMDGLEALKEIRNINKDAKVIIFSSIGQQGMVLEAIQNGAIDFIVKPFKSERIIEAMKNAFKN